MSTDEPIVGQASGAEPDLSDLHWATAGMLDASGFAIGISVTPGVVPMLPSSHQEPITSLKQMAATQELYNLAHTWQDPLSGPNTYSM